MSGDTRICASKGIIAGQSVTLTELRLCLEGYDGDTGAVDDLNVLSNARVAHGSGQLEQGALLPLVIERFGGLNHQIRVAMFVAMPC